MPLLLGLNVWSRLVEHTFPYLDQAADGFDSLWFPDHVQYGSHKVAEGWSLLAYALARYPDKTCGHAVLCNSFRNPALLAKMAATLQSISGGRVVLGIGAGWNEEEYQAYDWTFPSTGKRIAQLDEAIELIRLMWRESPASYEGEHYRIVGAHCEPRPETEPPIMVGGSGERYLLRVVARHADWWNYLYLGPEAYRHKRSVLARHCSDVGRDFDEIRQAVHCGIVIGETQRDLARLRERSDVRPPAKDTITGTDGIIVHFCDAPRTEGTRLFVEEVVPQL
jgi:alkanesulfonate monooxygenase SsuD/methylene tetrahydromethanopterin reductase-like flavin-dependent oxidoreductase (luciferase family)